VISFKIDGLDEALETLADMEQKIHHFGTDIRHELSDWQVADMHRKKPGTRKLPHGGYTIIRPHSRYEMRRSRLATRKHFLRTAVTQLRTTTRPILREILLDQLRDRMTALLRDKLHFGER
jgi:hypothetical protein